MCQLYTGHTFINSGNVIEGQSHRYFSKPFSPVQRAKWETHLPLINGWHWLPVCTLCLAMSRRFTNPPIGHEQSFRDIPRLSTVQALLILIKAREAVPKRGHYYRSWMSVVTMVQLAKDLELHEHLALHREGLPCGSSVFDCVVKSRVWFTLYVVEIMVGGPQGKSDSNHITELHLT